MTTKMLFAEAEQMEPDDVQAIGDAAWATDIDIVTDAIGYPHHWAGFTVTRQAASVVRVSKGRLFKSTGLFSSETNLDVNVMSALPMTNGDKKWIALLIRGAEQTETANRLFETDAETGETVLINTPKVFRRQIDIVIQHGEYSPAPVKPAVSSTECCLAYVLLTNTGIVLDGIEMSQDDRLKSLAEVELRLSQAEEEIDAAVRRVATIETDVANLAQKIGTIPRPEVMRQLKNDVAAVRRKLSFPDATRAYFYDAGLLPDAWDYTHVDWLARIKEGIRFSYANLSDSQLALLDPGDTGITASPVTGGNLVLPAWTEKARISVEGQDGSKNISQLVHTVTTAIRREVSRSSVSYGPTVNVCENRAEWSGVSGTQAGQTFTANGESFVNLGLSQQADMAAWNATAESAGHKGYAVAQLIYDSWTEVYWDYVTETFGVNGSVYGQTFLCAQPMIATSVDLLFTRVGTDGDVHLMLCETSISGTPRLDRVVARTTRAHGALTVGWNKFSIRPSLLESGRRYAWVTVTTGNHALATVSGNKFAQGSLMYSTDSAWFQGSTEEDFAFRLNAAEFAATRTVVPFNSLVLENGMTELRLLYAGWEPGGTSLVWEIKPQGAAGWTAIGPANLTALTGLPPLTQIRAVFLGTTDLMPAIILDSKARGYCGRHRTDMKAVSKSIAFGLSTTSIQIETVVDNFDPAHHTIANKVVVGGTVYTPSLTTITPDLIKSGRYTYLSTITVPSTTSARLRLDSTTDSVSSVPFVQNVALYAL